MDVIKDFFKKVVGAVPGAKQVVNLVPGVCVDCDPHTEVLDTAGVHYSSAKLTHKEATRRMKEYGMSAHYNVHNDTWTVKCGERTSIDESFRVAVQNIKVK